MSTKENVGSDRLLVAAGQKTKEQAYWLEQMADSPLRSCFPHRETMEHAGDSPPEPGVVAFDLEEPVSDRLVALSRGSDVRLHIILTALVTLLLGKYSGHDDVVVGAPILKADQGDGKGLLNRVVPIRSRLAGDMTFKEFLLQVRETCIGADQHRNYPVELLAKQLKLPAVEGGFPLFDTAVLLENIHDAGYLSQVRPGVVFSFRRHDNGISGGVEYRRPDYADDLMKRVAAHFRHITGRVLENPDTRLLDVQPLLPGEAERLLLEFNGPGGDHGPYDIPRQSVHQLFREQVARTPDRIALTAIPEQKGGSREINVSYRELDLRSDRLAGELEAAGLGAGQLVAITAKRSAEMIVGLVAILKAGGAYLPINPDYPEKRRQYLLTDSGARFLLTAQNRIENPVPADEVPPAVAPGAPDRQAAYVLYTSGTTGNPKGVMVDHRGVVRLVKRAGGKVDSNHADSSRLDHYVDFSSSGRIMPTGALEFDASTFEIWGGLLNGLVLCLAPQQDILIPARLKQNILKYRISVIFMTTPLFKQMVQTDPAIFGGLSRLLVGGESLSSYHVDLLRRGCPSLPFINCYGPTENTTFSTILPLCPGFGGEISIGKSIPGSTVYIVEPYGHPVPVGVVGEILVGGVGVARGYLNRPELTAEKFDFAFDDRVYKTGDLGMWLPDGAIRFMGRVDHQVKVRGFRVELGEIEGALLAHPQLTDAAVIDLEKPTGEKYLCAYFVSGEAVGESVLREFLTGSLPDYMIPAAYVRLERIPLTGNGKTDRRALPPPEMGSGVIYVAPRDEMEQQMLDLWAKELKLPPESIGIEGNFFEVGGNSITAMRIAGQMKELLDVDIPLMEFFRVGTIREIAEIVRKVRAEAKPSPGGRSLGGRSLSGLKLQKVARVREEI